MNIIKLVCFSLIFSLSPVFAQDIDGHPLPKVATNPLDAINEMIAGYGTDIGYQALLWGTYKLAERATAAIELPATDKDVKDQSKPDVADILTNFILSPTDPTQHNSKVPAFSNVGMGSSSMQDAIARLPGSDFALPGLKPNDDNFSFNSLVDPTEYQEAQSGNGGSQGGLFGGGKNKKSGTGSAGTTEAAQNFIAVFSQIGGQPLVDAPSGNPNDLLAKPNFARFVNFYRGYAASQSVALANLEYMFAERKKVKQLGYQAGLTSEQNGKDADASPLKVDYYLATKRLNKDWYKNMETSTPVAVERETLYVLAEMRYELYLMRRDNERILGALTALQLNSNFSNRENLVKPAHDQIGQTAASSGSTQQPTQQSIQNIIHQQ